jgi:hypothetical protein
MPEVTMGQEFFPISGTYALAQCFHKQFPSFSACKSMKFNQLRGASLATLP